MFGFYDLVNLPLENFSSSINLFSFNINSFLKKKLEICKTNSIQDNNSSFTSLFHSTGANNLIQTFLF